MTDDSGQSIVQGLFPLGHRASARSAIRPLADVVAHLGRIDPALLDELAILGEALVLRHDPEALTRRALVVALDQLEDATHRAKPKRPTHRATHEPVSAVGVDGWRDGRYDPEHPPQKPRCTVLLDRNPAARCTYRGPHAYHAFTWFDDDDDSPRARRYQQAREAFERGESVNP
ncbi:hypothetical protein CcI49_28480 [Frankia sp. CcI49]|uniref:hypothetical protein n=1 Tax=Frankia sp. CcI49 TaxID=1745382 RepID=UPI0009772F17|nr:hypothetical protein [Frankia sp. CcI49]ONH55462.1 hypothetical protein CcI49_28480 [Frankia sp. CcI49]